MRHLFLVAFFSSTLFGQTSADAAPPAPASRRGLAPYQVQPVVREQRAAFPLTNVRLLAGPFKEAKEKDIHYLLENEPDRLLYWHRKAAGLVPKAEHYGGWENGGSNLLGHYLTACAQMYASTDDPRLLERVRYIVAELAECQRQRPDGALFNDLGMASNFDKMRRGEFSYRVVGPEFPLVNGGNPWYSIHKVMAGLRDAYRYGHDQQARAVLVKQADWAYDFAMPLADSTFQRMLDVEHGGMTEVLADVYAITGDKKYAALARKFVHQRVAQPIAAGRDMLYPHHANAQIPKFVGYERLYQLTGETDALAGQSAQQFWDLVLRDHTTVIGGNSEYERFGPAGQVSQRIGYSSSETCNTYNMLKLSELLYQRTGQVKYMDYYERGMYNHLLGSLGPEEGMFCYYTNLKPGFFKTFSTKFNSSWCCVGSGMENPAKYEEAIYSHQGNTLFVNLFVPSRLTWPEQKLVLRQTSHFPESDTVRLQVEQASGRSLTVQFRRPQWAQRPQAWVNGQPIALPATGDYLTISRRWKKGDHVQVVLPMQLHLERTPDNPNIAALLYGPVVLAGELGTQGMARANLRAGDMWENNKPRLALQSIPFFIGDSEHLGQWIRPVPGRPLAFTAPSAEGGPLVTLSPFYKLNQQRYSVYWDWFSPAEWQVRTTTRQQQVRDVVAVADSASEISHGLRGEKTTTGVNFFRKYRSAGPAGWFTYDLAAGSDQPLFLVCKYWGSGWGDDTRGVLDLFVENAKVGTQDFAEKDHETLFFDAIYPIPTQLTQGKAKVAVRFQPRPGPTNTGLIRCQLVTAQGLVVKDLLKEQ
jgi:DUF1680 family protein